MGKVIGYVRVSTDDQDTSSQRHSIEKLYKIDRWYSDEAISGATKAQDRKGFSELLSYVREEDTVVVSAIDRLGRDTINVLEVVQLLQDKQVSIISVREGFDISTPIGKAMLTMLSAVAELERANIKARQMAGIEKAKAEGRNLGRAKIIDDAEVAQWRKNNNASIKTTAEHFDISIASVKRACSKA